MPNGKIGDHPLTDIFAHNVDVYGKEATELIRKIASLSSHRELDEWWEIEIGWNCDSATALKKAKAKHEELVQQAKSSGWETK
ncbi:MAG TPA: hypothetical protein PKN95_01680 [Verrucomicrobiota bacterium]|nr:hypothetical protein [Verrucomicrobiota bacterium]HNT13675.1 hypothetical protein [Verrucomicrobiota bacterium]